MSQSAPRLSCTVCDYESELQTSPVFVFEDRWNPLNPRIEHVWCHGCNDVSRAARSLDPHEIREVLNQEARSLDDFKRRTKRWLRGYTEKDQKRITELEAKLHALKFTAKQLPRVTLGCFVCGCEVCDRLFQTVEPPGIRGVAVVVDWNHECGGDLICHPPCFHYNRPSQNNDPQVTLDFDCRVVSTINCDPKKYRVGKHPSGQHDFLSNPEDIEFAQDIVRRLNTGYNNGGDDQNSLPKGDQLKQKALAKERELFSRLARVKTFPVVMEPEVRDQAAVSGPRDP